MPKINATWNPSDMNGTMTLSNGNLTVVSALAGTAAGNIRATHGKTSGKWYWELKLDAGGTTLFAGIASKSYPITSAEYIGTSSDALKIRAYYGNNGYKLPENVSYGAASVVGDTIGVAMNLDAGTLEFYKNGVNLGVSHTNLKDMGEVFPLFKSMGTVSRTITANFGATPFAYPIPSGYKAFNDERVDKFLISLEEEFLSLGSSANNLVPAMTSNITPSGIADSSSYVNETNAIYPPWRAFSQTADGNSWITSRGSLVGWISYKFTSPTSINRYSFHAQDTSSASRLPRDWTFEGSNDGTNWVVLDDKKGISDWTGLNRKVFDFNNESSYLYYRLNVSKNNGDTTFLSLRGLEYISKTNYSNAIEMDYELSFIKYGMSKGSEISLDSKFNHKKVIKSDSVPLGSGKVFKQKIDRSKHRANKIILG